MAKILQGDLQAKGKTFAIVVSRFNDFVTHRLLEGCQNELLRLGADPKEITIAWVPGSFEIPLVALKLAQKKTVHAVVCLGAIIRGETIHFDLVAHNAARGIAAASLESGKPIIFGLLATDTVEQAYKRAGKKGENRGIEAARNAVEMANLVDRLD